jgi:hypothetical protein
MRRHAPPLAVAATALCLVALLGPARANQIGALRDVLLGTMDAAAAPPEYATQYLGDEHRNSANSGALTLPVLGVENDYGFNNSDAQDVRANVSVRAFQFRNNASVNMSTYGDLVSMGGDFFGPTSDGEVICGGANSSQRMTRFIAAWRKLWEENDAEFVRDIIKESDRERDAILNKAPSTPAYEALDLGETRFVQFFDDDFLQLLLVNFDHFSDDCALLAYRAGHAVAMERARQAGEAYRAQVANFGSLSVTQRRTAISQARRELEVAYSMNAFADHFLTDLFSAGHVRTPRLRLNDLCGEVAILGASSAIAAQWMHDEDNRNGLLVRNRRGDTFVTFGDASFFDPRNNVSQALLREAVDLSRLEVYQAFDANASYAEGALDVIPDANASASLFSANNTCALYRFNGTVLLRRDPITLLRPSQWFADRGQPVANGSAQCAEIVMTRAECPQPAEIVASKLLPLFYTSKSLEFVNASDAWRTTFPSISEDDKKKLAALVIALIVIGGIIALAAIIGLVVCIRKRCNCAGGLAPSSSV